MTEQLFFKSKAAVLRYLEEGGWDISKTQFYDHCRDGLLLPLRSGENKGKYKKSTIKKYADLHVRKLETGLKETSRQERMRDEKLELSLERERIGKERDQFELDKKRGQFIPREEFEAAIVARAVAFMAHLNHTIQTEAPKWIDLVAGDQERAADLVDAVSKSVEQRMGDFAANAEISVIFEAN